MGVLADDIGIKRVFKDATVSLTRKNGLDCAWFAERVEDDALVVGYRSGAVSDMSDATVLRPGQGLGGLVFASNRVQAVDDYMTSSEITHDYDKAIAAESLTRVVGAPVTADGQFFGVLMGASRDGATFGNRASALIEGVAQRLSDTISAMLLRERLASLEAESRSIEAQLRELEARSSGSIGGIRCRERDVLERVALGHTNREIAQALQLSECTVKSYLRNVMLRLGARNRTEAIAYARKAGLL